MKTSLCLLIILLVSCAKDVDVPAGRADRQPDIVPAVERLDEPVQRIDRANQAMERRLALLERERQLLKEEAATWEQEMARWTERGLTAEQKLDLTLKELSRVRANWFAQLEKSTSGLRQELGDARQALDDLQTEKAKLLVSAAKYDQQAEEDQAQITATTARLNAKEKEVKDADRKIERQKTWLKITGIASLVSGLYFVARLFKLTPSGRAILFWLP